MFRWLLLLSCVTSLSAQTPEADVNAICGTLETGVSPEQPEAYNARVKRIVAHEQFTLSLRRCLLNALESNVEQRRIFAAELSSMWKGNDGALVAQLVKGLASPNDRLFNASLLAVRAIRPPQAIRNLSACLEDRKA